MQSNLNVRIISLNILLFTGTVAISVKTAGCNIFTDILSIYTQLPIKFTVKTAGCNIFTDILIICTQLCTKLPTFNRYSIQVLLIVGNQGEI